MVESFATKIPKIVFELPICYKKLKKHSKNKELA